MPSGVHCSNNTEVVDVYCLVSILTVAAAAHCARSRTFPSGITDAYGMRTVKCYYITVRANDSSS